MSKIKQISLAVCMALTPLSIYAAGLGKLNTQSALGEPLRAEIEVIATPEEIASLAAAIASEEAFATQGVTRLGVHNQIKIDVAKAANGKSVLKLRSAEPIKDPYLDLIIQMDWNGGQLQREYTLLLDPPTYKPTEVNAETVAVDSPLASTNTGAAVVTDTQVTKKSATKKLKRNKKRQAQPKVDMSVEVAADAQEATTKSGDTLSSIAKEMQVEGVSLDQMLAGLYKANQDAFIKGNINRLKVGQIIKVPTKESLTAISNSEAKQLIRAHSTNWNAYRNTMAKSVTNAAASEITEEKQTSTGKITTAEDKAAAAKTGPQDVVKLSAGDKNGASADSKLIALQEEAIAREKALKEGQERAAQLEAQINDMKKVLELKNQAMAGKQNASATTSATEAKAAELNPPAVSATTTEVKPVEVSATAAVSAVESAAVSVSATAVDASATASVTPTEVSAVQPASEVKTAPVVEPKPAAESLPLEAEEPSFLDGIFGGDSNLPLIGGGAGLALLGAGWMFLRNKRKKNLDSFERGILTSGGLRANTVFGNTTSNTSTSDTSFLTDFAQSVDGGMIDTNDVDPIAEAEVYMAYGRGAQAEEILKDAILKEPKRYELHLKLLEIYVDNKDAASFETIAGELYTTLGSDDPVWAKVAALGAKIEPENPLYDLSKIGTAAVATAAVANTALDDFEFGDSSTSAESAAEEVSLQADDNSLDFSLDDDTLVEASSEVAVAQEDNALDFSLADNADDQSLSFAKFDADDVLDIGDSITEPVVEGVPALKVEESVMDFDLGEALEINEPISVDPIETPEVAGLVDALPDLDLSLDLDDSGENKVEPAGLEVLPTATPVETLDFAIDFELPAAEQANDIALEEKVETPSSFASDFTFELPSEPVADAAEDAPELVDLPEPVANSFDMSSINLDLDGPTIQPANETELKSSLDAGVEPPDVEIKLDLVAVYMDMDDKVGAKELLEEVLKEGGVTQKERAKKLLDSLV